MQPPTDLTDERRTIGNAEPLMCVLRELKGHSSYATSVAMSSDAKYVVTKDYSESFWWNLLETGERLSEVPALSAGDSSASFNRPHLHPSSSIRKL